MYYAAEIKKVKRRRCQLVPPPQQIHHRVYVPLNTDPHLSVVLRSRSVRWQNVEITWTVSPVCPPEIPTVAGVCWREGASLWILVLFKRGKDKSNGGETANALMHITSSVLVSLTFCCCRCGQRWECQRGSLQGQWLWSFNQAQQCLSIQHLSFYNISRGEKTDVMQGREWGNGWD